EASAAAGAGAGEGPGADAEPVARTGAAAEPVTGRAVSHRAGCRSISRASTLLGSLFNYLPSQMLTVPWGTRQGLISVAVYMTRTRRPPLPEGSRRALFPWPDGRRRRPRRRPSGVWRW